MESHRKLWNDQQKTLRRILGKPECHQQAIDLFLKHHVMVHSARVAPSGVCSFADEVWSQGLSDELVRCIPSKGNHSIAWIFWHLARIEDVTMNLLVAGTPQLFHQENWPKRLKSSVCTTGNGMTDDEVVRLSAAVDLKALQDYRVAVGRRTRDIVVQLQPQHLKQKVEPLRLQRVRDEGAIIEAAERIAQYWGKRTIAGLLLMPPTRHNFLHLNEARRVKQTCLR